MASDDYPTSIRIPRELRDNLIKECALEQEARGGPKITLSWLIVDIIRLWVEKRRADRK